MEINKIGHDDPRNEEAFYNLLSVEFHETYKTLSRHRRGSGIILLFDTTTRGDFLIYLQKSNFEYNNWRGSERKILLSKKKQQS